MKNAILAAALVTLAALPAHAADGPLDLGFARAGMSLADFRQEAWPAGAAVLCTGDADLPEPKAHQHFDVPKGVDRLGGIRCGLFQQTEDGPLPYDLDLAGTPTEIWAMFVPGRDGTPRLLQLLLKQSPDSFTALADYFSERFGPAQVRTAGLARWEAEDADAAIIEDGGKRLHAYLIDNRLQAALNARMSQHPRPRGATRESHP